VSDAASSLETELRGRSNADVEDVKKIKKRQRELAVDGLDGLFKLRRLPSGSFLHQILNLTRSWAATVSPEHRAPVEFPRVSVQVECRAARAGYRAAGEYPAVAWLVRWPRLLLASKLRTVVT
jgi:hypothetical protein